MSEEKGFIIKDKDDAAQKASKQNENQQTGSPQSAGNKKRTASLPVIDFSTFLMSLNASALVNLGVIDDPVSGKSAKNLAIGKQTIDIISMLEEKTRGNLTPDEAELVKGLLYDLRITFVKQSSG